jgi:amidophosphoribosyltransferase
LSLKESCGVFGAAVTDDDVLSRLYWGILAQNHRGQQSHGFAIFHDGIHLSTKLGMVKPPDEEGFHGNVGIANVRYATSGPGDSESLKRNAMPIAVGDGKRSLAISFNGNIVNVRSLQNRVGVDSSYSDTHALALLLLREFSRTGSISEAVKACMVGIDGAFSVTGITDDGILFAFKDPKGLKPLCYGRMEGAHAFSSESVGLDINGFIHKKELVPGELMIVKEGKISSLIVGIPQDQAFCAFEYAYFARPDSKFNGKYVYQARREFGRALVRRYQKTVNDCDIVISLPETANDAAYGFHEESGLPWDMATRRHRYMTERAFIASSETREDIIVRKVNILGSQIEGKKLAIVDDSIVRGDTTRANIKRFRTFCAKEIHLFITFPRIIGPCFYGIDMSTYSELIGVQRTPEEIAVELGADSVNYLLLADYIKATGMKGKLCTGCITGKYPTPLASELSEKMKDQLLNGKKETSRIYE